MPWERRGRHFVRPRFLSSSKVLKLTEVLKIFTNAYASIGKAETLKVLWLQVKKLILA